MRRRTAQPDVSAPDLRPAGRPGHWLRAALVPALVVLAVAVLLVLRPGVVLNGVASPRVWLLVLAALVGARLLRRLVLRLTGSRSWAQGSSSVALLLVVVLVLAPSFRQRTVEEPDPFAATPAATAGPPQSSGEASGEASGADAGQGTPGSVARTVAAGALRGLGHRAEGEVLVQVLEGRAALRFVDVDVEGTPGPEVHLVPRGESTPGAGVRLGALTAERGSFSYLLPDDLDAAAGWSVLVWCRPFDTPVAIAELSAPG
jgi:hypothetical protein